MSAGLPAYGLWSLVVINVAVFAIFAFSFTRPRTARDWRKGKKHPCLRNELYAASRAMPSLSRAMAQLGDRPEWASGLTAAVSEVNRK